MRLFDFYEDSPTKEKTRGAILNAAYTLFSERGVEAVSMKEIADKAGLTTRNLYRYYASQDLLLVDTAYQVLMDDQNMIFTDGKWHGSGFEKVSAYLNRMAEKFMSGQEHLKLMKFIMYFDLFIATLPETNPAFIKYTRDYVKHIQNQNEVLLLKAYEEGLGDGSIAIQGTEPSVMAEYLVQSTLSVIMRTTIKEHENKAINKDLVYEHIKVLEAYLRKEN